MAVVCCGVVVLTNFLPVVRGAVVCGVVVCSVVVVLIDFLPVLRGAVVPAVVVCSSSRCPDHLLASSPRGLRFRGYDLVRSRRPEHGVEHAEQLPGHRHDSPLLTAAMHQPREPGSPFRALADEPPGGLHHAHRNSPEPSLVILMSLDFFSPLCRTIGTSPA